MSDLSPGFDPPPLGPGDVYVYALGNGAIFLLAEGRGRLVTLADALDAAVGTDATGALVLVARDHTPLAETAIDALRAQGLELVEVPDAPVPQSWPDGTDALIEAAASGADALLDDLLARGADVSHRDVSGSTALHHAAGHGNVHAVDALVAAGADCDLANRDGLTPLGIARATRQEPAILCLIGLGAGLDAAAGTAAAPVTFRGSHAWSMWYLALLPIPMLITVAIFLWPLSLVDGAVVAVVAAAYVWLAPPRPFWAGGVARGLAGDRLLLRTLTGKTRMVDLADVSGAALAGASRARAYGGRMMFLAHPDGEPTSPRQLRQMGLPKDEVAVIGDRFQQVIAVPMSGAHREEVILAVGNRLSGLGVDLSANLRRQLAESRAGSRAA